MEHHNAANGRMQGHAVFPSGHMDRILHAVLHTSPRPVAERALVVAGICSRLAAGTDSGTVMSTVMRMLVDATAVCSDAGAVAAGALSQHVSLLLASRDMPVLAVDLLTATLASIETLGDPRAAVVVALCVQLRLNDFWATSAESALAPVRAAVATSLLTATLRLCGMAWTSEVPVQLLASMVQLLRCAREVADASEVSASARATAYIRWLTTGASYAAGCTVDVVGLAVDIWWVVLLLCLCDVFAKAVNGRWGGGGGFPPLPSTSLRHLDRRPPGAVAVSKERFLAVVTEIFRTLADPKDADTAPLAAVVTAMPDEEWHPVAAFMATAGLKQLSDGALALTIHRLLQWPMHEQCLGRVLDVVRAAVAASRVVAVATAVSMASETSMCDPHPHPHPLRNPPHMPPPYMYQHLRR